MWESNIMPMNNQCFKEENKKNFINAHIKKLNQKLMEENKLKSKGKQMK